MRRARPSDVPILVDLMTEFYSESGYALNRDTAASAFATLIADERLGSAWLLESTGAVVGHAVVTLRFAMEYGGLVGCLDDLFVRPTYRNQGISRRALEEIREFCRPAGIRAMMVEVSPDNGPAQAVYRGAGFKDAPDRQVLYLELAEPAHAV